MNFQHPQVAEKFIPKLKDDVKIATPGYHGHLSKITPRAAKLLSQRDNPYLAAKPEAEAKPEEKKKVNPAAENK